MLMLAFALTVTVGLANADVNELNRSDEVILINNPLIGINNAIDNKTVFSIKKVDNYASIGKTLPLKFKAYGQPVFFNTDMVLLCGNREGGRSPPERVVKKFAVE